MISLVALMACTNTTHDPAPLVPFGQQPLAEIAMAIHAHEGGVSFRDAAVEGAWSVDLALTHFGRGAGDRVDSVSPVSDGSRTSFEHGGFVEWYEALDDGMKQGIDVPSRPRGQGPLSVTYRVESDLFPIAEEDALRLVDANGHLRFSYNGLYVYDAEDAEVPSWMEVDCDSDCTVRLVVDDADAVYPLTIDPLAFSNESLITSPAGVPDINIRYGFDVDISGDFAIVGAPDSDTGSGSNRGEAYIYTRTGTSWAHTFTVQGTAANDRCGHGVALSGNRFAVGCPFDGPQNRGVIRVFLFNGTTWVEEFEAGSALLQPVSSNNNQRVGFSVDLSNDSTRLIAGGWGRTNTPILGQVGIWHFDSMAGVWVHQVDHTPSGLFAGTAGDRYGFAVSIDGDRAVVGAPRHDRTGTSPDFIYRGRGYMMNRVGGVWGDTTMVAGTGSNDVMGYSVAVDDITAAFGAPTGQGEVQVWTDTAPWTLQATLFQDVPVGSDRLGNGVDLDGDRLVAGASRDDNAGTDEQNVGSLVVYDRVGSTWTQEVEVLTRATSFNSNIDEQRIGFSAGVSGDWVIGGSNPRNAGDVETAHLFQLTDCVAETGQPGCDVDLMITEIHSDSTAGVDGEFIELYNAGTTSVQLRDAVVSIDAFTFNIDDSFVIGPDEHAIIARTSDDALNGGIFGVPGMYVDSTFSLDEGATISVTGTDSSILATMTYSGFDSPGSSLSLSHNGITYADPSVPYTATSQGNWCPTFEPRTPGNDNLNFSSPREENESCSRTVIFDFDFTGVGMQPDAVGSTTLTLLGNRFSTGNGGDGDITYSATSAGQTMTMEFDGPGTVMISAVRPFGDTCFSSFAMETPSLDPNFSAGLWDSFICP